MQKVKNNSLLSRFLNDEKSRFIFNLLKNIKDDIIKKTV